MKQSQGTFLHQLLWMLLSLLITVVALGSFAYLYLDSQLPDVAALKSVQLPIPLRVYASDGSLLAEFGEISRDPITIDAVPPLLIKAILATEDQRFYEHSGVDIFGLLRATGELILTGTKAQGGSTITMQVARNFYLTRKKTFIRKFTEIALAMKIEREFTKQQILELYLNKIYLGNRAYGVAAAAQIYYGKPLNELTLPEIAMIAGLPKAPSTINPLANPIAAKDRRNHVLDRMNSLGYIDQATYEAAVNTPLTASYHGPEVSVHAPYVAEMVRDMMLTSFGDNAYTKGYNVYTTINIHDQLSANQAVRSAIVAYDMRHGYRGAERHLDSVPPPNQNHAWLSVLQKIPTYNDMMPAVVTSVSNNSVTAFLGNSNQITIPWQGLSWARPQGKDGVIGPEPKSAKDIVKVGDVIRVQQQGNTWQLTELPQIEAALVALNPQSGAILALDGGFDFQQSKFNRVTQAHRQPGSGFKPFIYAAALAKGYTLASEFNDAPIVFSIPGQDTLWRPQNDDHTFLGPTRLRVALAYSRNVVTVRLLQAIGVPYAINYATRFGFEHNQLPRNLSFALGTASVTPLQLVRGYAIFANGGYRITPYLIDHITDNDGKTIYQAQPKTACAACNQNDTPPPNDGKLYAPRIIPVQIAFLMDSALKDVIHYGTGRAAQVLNRQDLAGKTGTTSDYIDTWFTGFNSDIVATVWMGFDQESSIYEYGSKAALPLWIDFMRSALQNMPENSLAQPYGITSAPIDPVSGNIVSNGTPGAIMEYFRAENEPKPTTLEPPLPGGPDNLTAPPSNNATGNSNNSNANNNEPLF